MDEISMLVSDQNSGYLFSKVETHKLRNFALKFGITIFQVVPNFPKDTKPNIRFFLY